MPFDKVYELICDNTDCAAAMNHFMGTKSFAKKRAKELGHIVVGNKCYCDQECYDTRNEVK